MYSDNEEARAWVERWAAAPHPYDEEVNSVEEAVAEAKARQLRGECDWFRGQPGLWPIVSSVERLGKVDRERARNSLEEFIHWIHRHPGLGTLTNDQAIGIAQHYGLPTPFVDFTSDAEVAAFFATTSEKLKPGARCSIICLKRADLVGYFANYGDLTPEVPTPEVLEFDVPDLWRLHSQKGGFLCLPFIGLENLWPPNRIIFPFTRPHAGIPRTVIFPERKSELELRLDSYFQNVETEIRSAATREWLEQMGKPFHTMNASPYLDQYLDVPKLKAGAWKRASIEPGWFTSSPENFFDVWRQVVVNIDVPAGQDLAMATTSIETALARLNAGGSRPRSVPIDWRISIEASVNAAHVTRTTNAMNRAWDGMRRLPYTDAEIARTLAMCVKFGLHWVNDRNESKDLLSVSPMLPDALRVEVADMVGGYCPAYVSRSSLLKAVRKDFCDVLLSPQRGDILSRLESIVQVVRCPPYLYEFDALREVFVESLVATQCVVCNDHSPIFSPALCMTLGLP